METQGIKVNSRKLELIVLSTRLKPQVDLGVFPTINKAILHHYQTLHPDITEFNSFKQWISTGYKVKKGQKGFPIWTKPMQKGENNDTENPYKFFGMCYLFSNLQVEKI